MQAILTKYFGPSNVRGSRVKASCQAKTIILGWDDSLNSEENHAKAANQLADILGWLGRHHLESGCLPDGSYCHVLADNVALDACRAAVSWASEGRNHGGNPEFYSFVKLARKATGRE